MNKSSSENSEKKGKSKAQSNLEATLQGTTRRFSAFEELGIPSLDPQVEGIALDSQESDQSIELPLSKPSPPSTVIEVPPVLGDVLCELSLNVIVPNPHQPRLLQNTEANDRLLNSIKNSGVIQPIIVRRVSGAETYELIAGERRWRACQEIGKDTIPAIIREADTNQSAAESLIENLVREDLTPLEESKAYQRLIDDHSFSQAGIADRTGVTPGRISQLLKLLSLPSEIQDLLYNSETPVSSSHGELLATINNDPARQKKLANRVVQDRLSREDLKRQLSLRPRNNKGFEPVQFVDRGEKGYNLTVRFHSNRPQDLTEIEGKLSEALTRVRSLLPKQHPPATSS